VLTKILFRFVRSHITYVKLPSPVYPDPNAPNARAGRTTFPFPSHSGHLPSRLRQDILLPSVMYSTCTVTYLFVLLY
jgi:hypothetical protein